MAYVFVERLSVELGVLADDEQAQWPFTVPCVDQLTRDGLPLRRPITFLIGENGSGKSTVVEAVADAWGVESAGGKAGRKYGSAESKTPLGETLRLGLTNAGARMMNGPRTKRRGYFLRAETTVDINRRFGGWPGYWQEDLESISHGQGFWAIFRSMFGQPGLYLLDEPEAALSFSSCLALVGMLHELAKDGSQVICATHSPILAATPDADIVELGDFGFRRAAWTDLDLVDHWRRYLADPGSYLRHVIDS
jgi:predicted ATPase